MSFYLRVVNEYLMTEKFQRVLFKFWWKHTDMTCHEKGIIDLQVYRKRKITETLSFNWKMKIVFDIKCSKIKTNTKIQGFTFVTDNKTTLFLVITSELVSPYITSYMYTSLKDWSMLNCMSDLLLKYEDYIKDLEI